MNVNLTGILRTCQSFYKPLLEHQRGRIVNIASIGAFASLYQVAAYNSSKAGVIALTRSLAIEWGKNALIEDLSISYGHRVLFLTVQKRSKRGKARRAVQVADHPKSDLFCHPSLPLGIFAVPNR